MSDILPDHIDLSFFDRVIPRRGTDSIKWDTTPEDVLPMWVADMDFACPPAVTSALQERLTHPVLGYTRIPRSYRDAVTRWIAERHRLGSAADEASITVCPGVMPSIRTAIDAFTVEGDSIVLQPPVYFPFYDAISSKKRRTVRNALVRGEDGYRMDLDHLEQCFAQDRPAMMLLCSPHNPVARVWSTSELEALLSLCERYGVTLVSDEIHGDIVYAPQRFVSVASIRTDARTVVCNAPSKTFNIAGLGHSFVLTRDAQDTRVFRRALSQAGMDHPHVLGMVAAEAAYRWGEQWLDTMLVYLSENISHMRSRLKSELPDLGMLPMQGTFISWLDLSAYGSEADFLPRISRYLRLNAGTDFGPEGEGYMRLNVATSRSVLDEGIDRLVKALSDPGT